MAKKETRVRRTFAPRFKRDAVAVVHSGKSVTEVARTLGIGHSLLQYWENQVEQKEQEASAPSSSQRSILRFRELHRIRKSGLGRPGAEGSGGAC